MCRMSHSTQSNEESSTLQILSFERAGMQAFSLQSSGKDDTRHSEAGTFPLLSCLNC